MNFFRRLQFAISVLAGKQPDEFPVSGLPQNGRQSSDSNNTLSNFNSKYNYINPIFDTELLQTIQNLALFNPDFTQFVNQMISLGNQGHQIKVKASNGQQIEAVVNRINERSANLYKSGAGVDGLLNAYARQMAEAGAVSSEDVVDLQRKCVSKVVLVPTNQIRFRYDETVDEYIPLQLTTGYVGKNGNIVELNPLTYGYYPWVTPQNSPYAIPPGLGAVETIVNSQAKILESIPHIANRKSLLGLLSILINPLKALPNESEGETTERFNRHLKRWRDALSGNISDGLLLAYKGTEVKHTQTTGDSQGFAELHQVSEEQVFSGMNVPASLMGRSYAVAETWAKVVYEAYKGYNKNLFLPIKRRHERTLRLDCRLAGLAFDSISVAFNKMPSLNPQDEAQTIKIETETALLKARSGMISPDMAANENGYETYFDPNLLNGSNSTSTGNSFAALVYDQQNQKYFVQPEQIPLISQENVIDLSKKKTKVLDFQRSK
jgi:hypothetical protein